MRLLQGYIGRGERGGRETFLISKPEALCPSAARTKRNEIERVPKKMEVESGRGEAIVLTKARTEGKEKKYCSRGFRLPTPIHPRRLATFLERGRQVRENISLQLFLWRRRRENASVSVSHALLSRFFTMYVGFHIQCVQKFHSKVMWYFSRLLVDGS